MEEYYLEDVLEWTGFRFEQQQAKPEQYNYRGSGRKAQEREQEYKGFIAPFLRDIEGKKRHLFYSFILITQVYSLVPIIRPGR